MKSSIEPGVEGEISDRRMRKVTKIRGILLNLIRIEENYQKFASFSGKLTILFTKLSKFEVLR